MYTVISMVRALPQGNQVSVSDPGASGKRSGARVVHLELSRASIGVPRWLLLSTGDIVEIVGRDDLTGLWTVRRHGGHVPANNSHHVHSHTQLSEVGTRACSRVQLDQPSSFSSRRCSASDGQAPEPPPRNRPSLAIQPAHKCKRKHSSGSGSDSPPSRGNSKAPNHLHISPTSPTLAVHTPSPRSPRSQRTNLFTLIGRTRTPSGESAGNSTTLSPIADQPRSEGISAGGLLPNTSRHRSGRLLGRSVSAACTTSNKVRDLAIGLKAKSATVAGTRPSSRRGRSTSSLMDDQQLQDVPPPIVPPRPAHTLEIQSPVRAGRRASAPPVKPASSKERTSKSISLPGTVDQDQALLDSSKRRLAVNSARSAGHSPLTGNSSSSSPTHPQKSLAAKAGLILKNLMGRSSTDSSSSSVSPMAGRKLPPEPVNDGDDDIFGSVQRQQFATLQAPSLPKSVHQPLRRCSGFIPNQRALTQQSSHPGRTHWSSHSHRDQPDLGRTNSLPDDSVRKWHHWLSRENGFSGWQRPAMSELASDSMKYRPCQWFFGILSRDKAERLLMTYGRNNQFLVRQSATKPSDEGREIHRPITYAISVRQDEQLVRHFKVFEETNGFVCNQHAAPFPSLVDLVAYHTKVPLVGTQTSSNPREVFYLSEMLDREEVMKSELLIFEEPRQQLTRSHTTESCIYVDGITSKNYAESDDSARGSVDDLLSKRFKEKLALTKSNDSLCENKRSPPGSPDYIEFS